LARPSELIVLATLIVGVVVAAVIDLRTRRVPNPLTATLAALGVAFAASGMSGLTIGASLTGLVLGLVLMLPGHLFGATGAGDVKLFAAVGALIGPMPIATSFLYTALAGGLLALVVAVRRQRLRKTLGGTARLISTAAANASAIAGPLENNRFAYAPAIAVGTLIAALGR
jgi:prepilin peptidase CpaA